MGEIDSIKEENNTSLEKVTPEYIATLAEPEIAKISWDFDG